MSYRPTMPPLGDRKSLPVGSPMSEIAVTAVTPKTCTIPPMPEGVRLVRWEPKPAPVILTHYAVVTDVLRFISMTLLELKAALAGKQSLAGHRSARELVDRLEECGILVVVTECEGLGGTH